MNMYDVIITGANVVLGEIQQMVSKPCSNSLPVCVCVCAFAYHTLCMCVCVFLPVCAEQPSVIVSVL